MLFDNNSLKLYDTVQNKSSTVEFQLFILIDRYSSKVNELKMVEPLFFRDDTWFIDIYTQVNYGPRVPLNDSHTFSNRSKESCKA